MQSSFSNTACDDVVQEPDPHLSVGWMLGDGRQAMEQAVLAHPFTADEWQQTISTITCIIGQRVNVVWSQAQV